LQIRGKQYIRGLCTHANSKIVYDLNGKYSRFQSWVGVDQSVYGSVTFEVYVDGKKKYNSTLVERNNQPRMVDVDVAGGRKLELVVTDGGNGVDGDHADWAQARLIK
jgi:hypothetical protein